MPPAQKWTFHFLTFGWGLENCAVWCYLNKLAQEDSTSLDHDSFVGPDPGPGPGPGFSKVTIDPKGWSFRGSISRMAVQKTVAKSWGSNRPKSTSSGECFFASLRKYLTIVLVSSIC